MQVDGQVDGGSTGRATAPAFNTGGGGFEFEDLVGAWAAAGLAAGASPLGVEIGIPRMLRFQASATGRALDDLVVTGDADPQPSWSASIKSFDILTGSKLPEEFVESAWTELLTASFRPGQDRVGLVCASAAERNWASLIKLIGLALADPNGLAGRIEVKGAFSDTDRSIWKSCKCPDALASTHSVAVTSSPARLLAALIPLRLDLLAPASQSLTEALAWCRTALIAEQANRVQDLWDALCGIVSDLRPKGGVVDWPLLAARLGERFAFRLRPDVEPDERLLAAHTAAAVSGVRDHLGADIRLPRADAWGALESATASSPVMILTGPSGCGKTALAKRWLFDGSRHVWLSSTDLDGGLAGLRARTGLHRRLNEVLDLIPGDVRVVIDGLDRSYEHEHFAGTALIARTAVRSGGRVRLLITSQQMELLRVTGQLAEADAPPASPVAIEDLDDSDLQVVLENRPELARIAVAGRLENVLRRPKLLDLVLRATDAEDVLKTITDEAAVAHLWWERFVLGAEGAAPRQELLMSLATHQADNLAQWTPAGDLGAADVERADQLRHDGVLDEDRARYAFAHDLFADWTLLQRLRALGGAALSQVGGKSELPTWHRAIRLHALTILRDEGLDAWSSQRAWLDANEQRLASDLFLDAAVFANDAARLLQDLWPVLLADKGALLQRLLRRFLLVATVPDPRGAVIFRGVPELETHWSAQLRFPLWPLWLPVVEVLHEHRAEAIPAAPTQVAAVTDLWLRRSGRDWPRRDLAAEIAIALGRFVVDESAKGASFDDKAETALWRAALAAGAVDPQAVLDLVVPALEMSAPSDHEVQQ